MQIIAVENNTRDLAVLRQAILGVFPESSVFSFSDPLLAIKHCVDHPPDLIISERNLKRMDGFALIKTLQQKFPLFDAVLISESNEWRRDAENLMLGFVEKPVTAEKLAAWKVLLEASEL